MKCDVCGGEVPTKGYMAYRICPHCGQEYDYDEGYMIILSDEQKEVLRKHALEVSMTEDKVKEAIKGAEESAIHREKLCKASPRCPTCLTDQVQLVDWSSEVAEWRCRKNACRQVFKFELV